MSASVTARAHCGTLSPQWTQSAPRLPATTLNSVTSLVSVDTARTQPAATRPALMVEALEVGAPVVELLVVEEGSATQGATL
jgi:hypothetical protein